MTNSQHGDKNYNILQVGKHLYCTMGGYIMGMRASLQNNAVHKQGFAKVHQCETETRGCTRDITAQEHLNWLSVNNVLFLPISAISYYVHIMRQHPSFSEHGVSPSVFTVLHIVFKV